MIRVFVGSNTPYAEQEKVLAYSIRANTEAEVEVTFMRPGENGLQACGCTGFSNYRYCVPELADHQGFAIYLDVDMIVMGDIRDLYVWKRAGKWAVLADGSNEVAVIDCTIRMPEKERIHTYPKQQLLHMTQPYQVRAIPLEWNVEDRVTENMKLLHFTDLNMQPWLGGKHQSPEALGVLQAYQEKARHSA